MISYPVVAVMDGNKVINIVKGDIGLIEIAMPQAILINATEDTGYPHVGGYLVDGRFRRAQPFPSWLWNDEREIWEAPIPYPDDGNIYYWDGDVDGWVMWQEGEPNLDEE